MGLLVGLAMAVAFLAGTASASVALTNDQVVAIEAANALLLGDNGSSLYIPFIVK